ncbi:MAG: helix-hairpin-helix domain-containing protein [Desulfuromonadaceae bacterium]
MRSARQGQPTRLEELPNIGKSIAADLRAIGILLPQQLAGRDPLATYLELGGVMGHRHDPCVLYTLMSVQHFLENGEALPWWTFTGEGKKLLATISGTGTRLV